MDERIRSTIGHFHVAHLIGGPYLLTAETAFLSFICTLSAIESLAGYRFGNTIDKPGERFRQFITTYFAEEYHGHAERLWDFRNGIIHAFTPRRMSITQGAPHAHLTVDESGTPVLNAQDFFAGMAAAAKRYIAALGESKELQEAFLHRLESTQGGSIHVRITFEAIKPSTGDA